MTRIAGSAAGLLLRLALGAVLLWAGGAKIPEPGLFAQTVRAYDVLPLALVNPFAIVVPWIEVVAGVCLLAGFWVRGSATAAAALLLSFGVALVVNVYRGADFSCGCFALDGTGGSLEWALVRDLVLLTGSALLVLLRGPSPFSVDRVVARRKHTPPAGQDAPGA